MNQEKLSSILAKHAKWLADKAGGVRADLSNTDLFNTDLSKAELYGADLRGAILAGADLSRADLREANMAGADLTGATLVKADLRETNMAGTTLARADLRGADLTGADLSRADLRGTDLSKTNLTKADLRGTDMSGADLSRADLFDTKLRESEEIRKGLILSKPMTGYKKTREDVVIKVKIPRGAIVFSINNSKCRTDRAEIVDMGKYKVLHSCHDEDFTYRPGKRIVIKDFNLQYNVECAPGFHFFRTRKEAEKYRI